MTLTPVSGFRPGMNVGEFLTVFLGVAGEISELTLIVYRPQSGVDQRLGKEVRRAAEHLAKTIGSTTPLPDGVLWPLALSQYLAEPETAWSLLRQALVHEVSGRREVLVRREDVNVALIQDVARSAGEESVVGLSSRVRLADGRVVHIPMLDFRVQPSDSSLRLLARVLRQIGQRVGVILHSGRSYHFYGCRLLDDAAWRQFMGQSLLLFPVVDVRYVAHRLIDGFGALRITTSATKPIAPSVVWSLED